MTEIRTAIPDEIDRYLDSLVRTGPFASKAELVRAALVAFAGVAGPIASGFDRENMMAPDGRIYQLEYAREGTMRGGPGVGVTFDGGVVLMSTLPSSPLVRRVEKIRRVGNSIALLSSGILSDAHILGHSLRQRSPNTTDELVDHLVQVYWDHAVNRTKRALCASLLVASALDGDVMLLEFDPSGAWAEVDAGAIGEDAKRRKEFLEKRYRQGSAAEAEELALECLGRPAVYEAVRLPP